jgi:hypothetical protein
MWIDQRGSEILPAPECQRLLALAAKDGVIGHVAVSDEPAPLVLPLNFAVHDGAVLVCIGPGQMSEKIPGAIVSFEVDRLEPDNGPEPARAWSVVLQGLASTLAADAAGAATLPHPLVPEPGDLLLTIRPDVVTGRRFPVVPAADSRPEK